MARLQAIICGMINRRSLVAALAAISMFFWLARDAAAQAYPARPVRLVVPAPAGGPTDVPGRLIADGLSSLFSQRFVVENRVGAGGLVGGEFVARSEPNGYTLLYANTSVLAVNPALQGTNMPYDPATAFAPVGFVSDSPQLLVANPRLPYRSVQELVAWAKSNPGRLNFATAGVGTLPHLTYELFKMEAGIQALNVPYAGGAPALTAVIAGQADVLFDLVRTRVKSGEVRALAITGASRDADLPDIPTLAESGYPAVTSTSGTGIVAPAGISREIVALLNSKLNELITDEAITGRFNGVQDAMKRLKSEIASAKLDVLIIVGDDQHELFQDQHMPSIGIYYGESIRNAGRANAKRFSWPEEWYNRAQMRRFEDDGDLDYPCHRPLALALIEGLIGREFDVAAVAGLG